MFQIYPVLPSDQCKRLNIQSKKHTYCSPYLKASNVSSWQKYNRIWHRSVTISPQHYMSVQPWDVGSPWWLYSTKSHSESWSVSGPWVKSARTYFNSPTFATWIQTIYTAHYSHGEYQFLGPCAYVLTTVQEQVLCDIHNDHFNPFKWKAGFDPKAALIAPWSYDTMLAALYLICNW